MCACVVCYRGKESFRASWRLAVRGGGNEFFESFRYRESRLRSCNRGGLYSPRLLSTTTIIWRLLFIYILNSDKTTSARHNN